MTWRRYVLRFKKTFQLTQHTSSVVFIRSEDELTRRQLDELLYDDCLGAAWLEEINDALKAGLGILRHKVDDSGDDVGIESGRCECVGDEEPASEDGQRRFDLMNEQAEPPWDHPDQLKLFGGGAG